MSGRYRWRAAVAVLASLLALGGCQSLPATRGASVGAAGAMPGELSRALYASRIAAVAALEGALSTEEATLEGIPLDDALGARLSSAGTLDADARADAVRRLAEESLLGAGPYRLVRADLPGGRLEFRSERTAMHLSVSVREPNGRERDAGEAFVVTDLFGQASLAALVRARSSGADASFPVSASSERYPAIRSIGPLAGRDDVGRLAYFDALPASERDRDDLLGLRALLMLRLGQDEEARTAIERGIVRYPESPLYPVLASVLFERAGAEPPPSLASIMEIRFTKREIRDSRRAVDRFLAERRGV